jgi:hypothetical protein
MDWIDLAQDRDRWLALFGCGNEPSVASQEGLCSMEEVSNEPSGSIKCGEFLD